MARKNYMGFLDGQAQHVHTTDPSKLNKADFPKWKWVEFDPALIEPAYVADKLDGSGKVIADKDKFKAHNVEVLRQQNRKAALENQVSDMNGKIMADYTSTQMKIMNSALGLPGAAFPTDEELGM